MCEQLWRTDEPPKDGTSILGVFDGEVRIVSFTKWIEFKGSEQLVVWVSGWESVDNDNIQTTEPPEAWMPVPEWEGK